MKINSSYITEAQREHDPKERMSFRRTEFFYLRQQLYTSITEASTETELKISFASMAKGQIWYKCRMKSFDPYIFDPVS